MDTIPSLYDLHRMIFDRFMVISSLKTLEFSIKRNFGTVGQISKCFTIIWGATKNAMQWTPSQPSRLHIRCLTFVFCPELCCRALGSHLWTQRVMSSIPGHGVKVGGKKWTKNIRFLIIKGWDGTHCLAFLEAPKFDVKHLEIGQETKKLGPLPPKCHEFESQTRQWSFSHHWPWT